MREILQKLKKFLERIKQLLLGAKSKPTSRKARLLFSWVIPGKLAVGGLPRSSDQASLVQANIQVILSLCATTEGTLPVEITQRFRCLRFILPDSRYASRLQVSQLAKVVDIVHRSLQHQMPIYVHCLAGIERSPTVCIAYLCRYQNLELWEAVNWLKQVHPYATPTEDQLRVVREFIRQTQKIDVTKHK